MPQVSGLLGLLVLSFVVSVRSIPVSEHVAPFLPNVEARGLGDWRDTLSHDTRHRLAVAQQHLDDKTAQGQAFRNDTIMRINIEREALDLPLIDLSQAFGMTLPVLRAAAVRSSLKKRSNAQDMREQSYLRSGTMTHLEAVAKRSSSNAAYSSLLNRENLALGAMERINIARRILGKPEVTMEEAKKVGLHGDQYLSEYWHSSMGHKTFWTTDQAAGKPNFLEGGQANGFGFTQSTFHKLHCLANLRMILAWHITGNSDKMTRDMNAHTIHCLEYLRWRELMNPDVNEEPIDTVDYKGMGIH